MRIIRNKEYIRFLVIGALALSVTYFAFLVIPPRFSQSGNDLASRLVYSFSKKDSPPFKFVAITIDERSLNKIPQRWPWKRSLYAELLGILGREKAKVIGIDFAFVGESEDKQDDRVLSTAIASIPSRVVLAYFFDPKEASPIYPVAVLKDSAYALGMLNTPIDADGKIRRLRGYVALQDKVYYSLSVMLSSAFLDKSPHEAASSLPLMTDRAYLINFLFKPKDIINVSFYDMLTNPEQVKLRYGKDFLKDSLVLVCPEAEILHDNYGTPLGVIPGGFTHLNGAANIITGKFLRESPALNLVFLALSFLILFYVLMYSGFLAGFLFAAGLATLNFWGLVLCGLNGLRYDYSYTFIFILSFFTLASLYKYVYFMAQVSSIKNKATLDPLRNLFTPRYFYYRLALEAKKIYWGEGLFLIFIRLEGFKAATQDIPMEQLKVIWKDIHAVLSGNKGKFWSAYSPDEVAGVLLSLKFNLRRYLGQLKNSLEKSLERAGIGKIKIRVACVKVKREYPVRELLFALSKEMKKKEEGVVVFDDSDLSGMIEAPERGTEEKGRILDSLDEDIEERNRELLVLIEDLSKEYAKSKEVFFQIITSLVNALEARDSYTEGHSERVAKYSLMLADKLGWGAEDKEKLRKAALLHDLGKIGIPDAILHKRSALNDEEYGIIKKHEIIGVKILEPLKDMKDILPWILYHHEKWDGSGYPYGLAGDAIPEAAQVISLADVFDAITTGRDYKIAFPVEEAIREITKNKGKQFNPRLADIFIEAISHFS